METVEAFVSNSFAEQLLHKSYYCTANPGDCGAVCLAFQAYCTAAVQHVYAGFRLRTDAIGTLLDAASGSTGLATRAEISVAGVGRRR